MKRILRPLMPPWSLTILKYASSVRSIAPYAPAGPSCGPQLPTTTSVSVTPTTAGLAVAIAAVADLADDTEDLLDQHRREAKGWLVEHKQAWPSPKRPSDCEHLLLAAAQRSGALLQPLA